jgi:copper transport protein
MRRLFAFVALAIVLGPWTGATPARAHAALVETEPAADLVLDQAPAAIAISFNEAVRPIFLRLIDGQGRVLADGSAVRVAGNRIELPVDGTLPAGGYIVTWRVISADAHPMGGSFRFAVGSLPDAWRSSEAASRMTTDARFWSIGLGIALAVHLAGLLLAAGGLWFVRLVTPGTPELHQPIARVVRIAAGVAAIGALAGVGLQGGLLLAAPASALLDISMWRGGLTTPIGMMLAASALGLGFVAVLASRPAHAAASLAALLAVVPLGLAGHVSVAEPRWLTGPSLILHVVCAAFWFGALPSLLRALRLLPARDAAAVLRRFSRLGVVAVLLLAVAGVAMAAIQLRGLSALWQTSYGIVLSAKLGLVAGLLLIALANKGTLTPALSAGRPGSAVRLARNIRLEIVLIAAVLALTAALGLNPPPRALQDAMGHAHPAATHHGPPPTIERRATAAGVTATLDLSPGRPGANILSVSLESAGGGAVDPQQVEAHLASAEHGIEPVTRRLSPNGDRFTLETFDMALPGIWQIRILVLVTDFDRATFAFEIEIR